MSDANRTLCTKYKIHTPQSLASSDLVLVIDDQQDLRLIISHQTQKLGQGQARQFGNGYDAIAAIKSENLAPQAIICDMDMPVMNGLDFLAELRESADLVRGPFLLTMDNVSKEKIMLAVENGVDEVLVKPFTLGDIGPKVRVAFNKFHNPNNPERVYELAKRSLREGKLDVAAKIYQDLAVAAPKAARPLVGLARIKVKEFEPDKALELLTEAEIKNPNFVHLYVERASILSARGAVDDALAALRKAIELSPLNAFRYKDAADLMFKTKRYEEAATLLEMAVGYKLEFSDLYHYLSQAKFALRDYKMAQKYVRLALQHSPENVVYLNQLGICFKEANLFDEALKTYNQVIKLDPGNTDALYNKSVLHNSQDETEEAIKLLERLLRKTPTFEPAKAKLAQYQRELEDKNKKKKKGAA